MSDLWTFNGIDARTGGYLLQASPDELAQVARGQPIDRRDLGELKHRHQRASESHFGVKEGVDPTDLAQAGWGAIFPWVKEGSPEATTQGAILEALAPLLEWRRRQATQEDERFFTLCVGSKGYRPGETKQQLLARQGVGPGPADPEKFPYYLLLVGDPETIPFRVQSQLGVQYAVGRICFPRIEDYASYARSVVAAESQALRLARRATFFGVENPDDAATLASARYMIAPLADALADKQALGGWSIERLLKEDATRANLADRLRGEGAPALLFTASHGMSFSKGDPLQLGHQGALLCQDWPGPNQWHEAIPEGFYLAGDHLDRDANLLGQVAFFFACYGGGTPQLDEFSKRAFKEREAIAPHAFVAGLPQAMLSLPKGGALAVIGHVERAWAHSFLWNKTGESGRAAPQLAVFQSALESLMKGTPVGAAMEYFDERYAELASDLSVELEEAEYGAQPDPYQLASLWTANNDARGYAVFGDPAVRIRTDSAPTPRGQINLGEVTLAGPDMTASLLKAARPDTGGGAKKAGPSAGSDATTTSFGLSGSPPAPAGPRPGDADARPERSAAARAAPPAPQAPAPVSAEPRWEASDAPIPTACAPVPPAPAPIPPAPAASPLATRGEDVEELMTRILERWSALPPAEVRTYRALPGEGAGVAGGQRRLVAHSRLEALGTIETTFDQGDLSSEQIAYHERMVKASSDRVMGVLEALLDVLKTG